MYQTFEILSVIYHKRRLNQQQIVHQRTEKSIGKSNQKQRTLVTLLKSERSTFLLVENRSVFMLLKDEIV